MLLTLVEHRPIALDYGRHPRARRAATGLVMVFCAWGLVLMFGLVAVALWAALSHGDHP